MSMSKISLVARVANELHTKNKQNYFYAVAVAVVCLEYHEHRLGLSHTYGVVS